MALESKKRLDYPGKDRRILSGDRPWEAGSPITDPKCAKYLSVVIVSASYLEQESGIFTSCCCNVTEEEQAHTQGTWNGLIPGGQKGMTELVPKAQEIVKCHLYC